MEFALNHRGLKVHASDANKTEEYCCPLCQKKVIPRQGHINIDHFAHQTICIDSWHYDMSEWHSEWQNQFPKKNQEVVVELDDEKHRADVMACGYVIEFQHSPITAEEFDRRTAFYLEYGKKVVWIFDLSEEYKEGRIECYDEWANSYDNGGKFKWSHPRRFLQNYLPQIDKDVIVFFQFSDSKHDDKECGYIERVTWAIEDEGCCSDFKRFFTSYYPGNFIELLECIKNHNL